MSRKPYVENINNQIMRVAHLGIKAFEGKGDPEDLDLAVAQLGAQMGLIEDEVVQGAMQRLALDADDLEIPEAPWSEVNSHWGEHPDYPHADWLNEIQNNDTRLGYAQWVDNQIEMALDDMQDPDPS